MYMMKCEMVKDLLALYAEDLCSPVTADALKEHLAGCPDCAAALERYRAGLAAPADTLAEPQVSKELKPLKKVKRKLRRKKITTIVLVVLLGCILWVIGVLSYGQMTNKAISFSTIADCIQLQNTTKALVNGDTQALIDVIAFNVDNVYSVKGTTELENFEAYKAFLKEDMDAVYAQLFEGRDITVKLVDLELIPFEDGVEIHGSIVADPVTTSYYFEFYEGETLVHSMVFSKIRDNLFYVYDEATDESGISFTASVLPSDELIEKIVLRYSVRDRYQDYLNGGELRDSTPLRVIIRNPAADEDGEFSERLTERLCGLEADGWYLKDTMFALDTYDAQERRWIYKIWFQFENPVTGAQCMMEQRFHHGDTKFYVIAQEPPCMLGADDAVPAEIQERILGLFS